MKGILLLKITVLSTVVAFSMALTGCGSSASARFYTLHSLAYPQEGSQETSQGRVTVIGIGPVEIPDYLDRPQIVTRGVQNELVFGEFDRWGGSLRVDVNRVLTENISVLLAKEPVAAVSWRTSSPEMYRIPVTFRRLDAVPGGTVFLQAQWSILEKDGRTPLLIKTTKVVQPLTGTGYDAVASAMSAAIEELSEEMVDGIKKAIIR